MVWIFWIFIIIVSLGWSCGNFFFVLRIYIATGFVEGQSGGVVLESSNESDCDSSVG
jgi:hypothetical protein